VRAAEEARHVTVDHVLAVAVRDEVAAWVRSVGRFIEHRSDPEPSSAPSDRVGS
jgi:hypothetical protein